MQILIAEDDIPSRLNLQHIVVKDGYTPVAVSNGLEAYKLLSEPDAPKIALLDWIMPGMDGLEICRKLRKTASDTPVYIIILTARDTKADIVMGLQAGANDYISKPYNIEELLCRVAVGRKVVDLQASLFRRITELKEAMAHIKTLNGIVPICAYCKKIRTDKKYWQQVEQYLSEHSEAKFSHGICPDCYAKHMLPDINKRFDQKT